MKNIREFKNKIKFLLTDIDDTLTDEGRLGPEAFESLWLLQKAGIHVIPVTGRPAGWCEMIARQWPVAGIVGENGGFYFRYQNQKMKRDFFFSEKIQSENREKLERIKVEILSTVPGCALASDQFCRLMDLAIDFCEDVPRLPETSVQKIVSIFESHGAHAKISSIHVNGWFGNYNKLTQSLNFLDKEFSISPSEAKIRCAFVGDSPNDEPMWAYFPNGIGVQNIQQFLSRLQNPPAYITEKPGGLGFQEVTRVILSR